LFYGGKQAKVDEAEQFDFPGVFVARVHVVPFFPLLDEQGKFLNSHFVVVFYEAFCILQI
jgi:hypothetical protein